VNPPRRKNIRLQGFDYASEAAYFITIVTKDREPLFGAVVDGEMVLNEFGEIVDLTWKDLINHNPNIGLGEFVIMPTHVHGIIAIFDPVGAGSKPAISNGAGYEPAPTRQTPLSEIVR
jgi:putative transposase